MTNHYDTVGQLREAYQRGEISDPLMIDNDSTFVYQESGDSDVFEMHPHDLLEQALDLLGIPHEHV